MSRTLGYAAQVANGKLEPWEFERRDVRPNDIAIDIEFAGICHSDIHQVREEWGTAQFPMVPGHEIVGTVTAVGSDVTKFKVGDIAGIGCFVDSCGTCEYCVAGNDHWCLDNSAYTYNGMERDGVTPTYGGYSKQIVVKADYALHIPANLDRAGAAPLLCAGVTTFSPLRHWNAGPGKKVAVMGLGGLGHMAVKIAVAMGADVTVMSHSESKRDDALGMGAHNFVVTSDKEALKKLANTFDIIINTVSADIELRRYIGTLRQWGSLVVVGAPSSPYSIDGGILMGRQLSLSGSNIGSIKETQEMLDFCGEHNIVSDVEIISATQINEAYERVVNSDVRYRFVIDTATI
ncbi:MAG: NAD(P)-dependent alcohol dehydrogenase [Actinomycetes bacterium]